MKIYNNNKYHIITLDKGSNRMKPFLFNSRSSVLDDEWKIEECSVKDIFYARLYGKRSDRVQSRKLQLSVMAIVNSFEFISCSGVGHLFGVDRTTAYRAIKSIPNVHCKGRIAIPTMYGIVAVFHRLMKNMYAMHRPKKGVSYEEEFHFLKADEASSMLLESSEEDHERFEKIISGLQLPKRTGEMLSIENKAKEKHWGVWRIVWIGAIPFIEDASNAVRRDSRHIQFCDFTGVPLGNYRRDESIYGSLMRVQLVSPMFPRRRDCLKRNSLGINTISELALIKH